MKKKTKIILAVVLSVVLLLGIGTGITIHLISRSIKTAIEDLSNTSEEPTPASVSETAVTTTSVTEPSVSDTTASAPTDAQTQTTEAPTTTAPTTEPPTTAAPTTEAPADALTLYNQAAASASFASASYSATMTNIVFSSSLVESFFDKNEAMNTCAVANASVPGTLTQIAAADCASAEMTDNGTQYTVTLKLNAVDLSIGAAPPQNGYPFFMDAASVHTQVSKVNDKLEYKNDGSITLSGGTLTAVIDKATGRMTSVTLTLTEVCKDGISMGSIGNLLGLSSLTGEFHYDITVQYK